jgi:mono/diheme cytochrome c family protein
MVPAANSTDAPAGSLIAVIKTKSSLTSNAVTMSSLPGGQITSVPPRSGFGMLKMVRPKKRQAVSLPTASVLRPVAPGIGLLAALVPAMVLVPSGVRAQTDIDQGKSPAQIFASDCAACHKAPKGLGNGKNSLTLSAFLREHYTASREQAAALAAYVLGAGSGPAADVAGRGQKPAAAAKADDPKLSSRTAKPPGKPDDSGAASAKLQDEPKADDDSGAGDDNGRRPVTARREPPGATRGRKKELPGSTPTIMAEPAATAAPETPPNPARSAAAPTSPEQGESAPVPRDNIPD